MGTKSLLPTLLLPGLFMLTSCYSEGQYQQQVQRADSLAQELYQESQLNDRLQAYIDDIYYQRTRRRPGRNARLALIHQTHDAYQNRVRHLLENPILFEPSSLVISDSAEQAIQAFVQGLIQEEYKAIMLVGHTDNQEVKRDSSWHLSYKRAFQIARYLMEMQIPADKIIPAGRGPSQPLVSNHRAQDRAINRRVEFYLIPPENTP